MTITNNEKNKHHLSRCVRALMRMNDELEMIYCMIMDYEETRDNTDCTKKENEVINDKSK
jgi:hypothetical protein